MFRPVFPSLTIDNRSIGKAGVCATRERERERDGDRERKTEEERRKESASFQEELFAWLENTRGGPRFGLATPFLRRYFIIRNSGHPSHFHRNGS